jgi:hypothetical protein
MVDNYRFLRKGQAVQQEYSTQKHFLICLTLNTEALRSAETSATSKETLKNSGLLIIRQIVEASSLTKVVLQ